MSLLDFGVVDNTEYVVGMLVSGEGTEDKPLLSCDLQFKDDITKIYKAYHYGIWPAPVPDFVEWLRQFKQKTPNIIFNVAVKPINKLKNCSTIAEQAIEKAGFKIATMQSLISQR